MNTCNRLLSLRFIAMLPIVLALAGCNSPTEPNNSEATMPSMDKSQVNNDEQALDYPATPRSDHTDTYFGIEVHDPYRWMEKLDSQPVQNWVDAQNAITQPWLEHIAGQDWLKQRLTELWNYERYSIPFEKGGKYFWFHNSGLQVQSVLYKADSLKAEPEILLDPNTFSKDGTIALARMSMSDDAKYLAYATSDGGTDWTTWHVLNIETGEKLDDFIDHTKFTSVSWLPDNSGFFYSRYPFNKQGEADASEEVSVYFHKLGTPQSEDRLVYDLNKPRKNPYAAVTDDGNYLVVTIAEGYNANGIHVIPLNNGNPGDPIELLTQWDALYTYIGNDGPLFYFQTNNSAPRGRVIAININQPAQENWTTIIPQQEQTLESVSLVGGKLFAQYLKDAYSQVVVYSKQGERLKEVELPGIGSVAGFGGEANDTQTFYSYESFTTPEKIYRYDIESGESTLFRETDVPVDNLDDYVVKQVFYTSKDGTRVPMFIIHKNGIELDGKNPTILYGYGGFNISLTPYYSAARMAWLEMGGVYAVANLRGGGEYGEAWHLAG
ncbi:MAG TPA: prolyl oligopeptidase family serine peptidase, partial [Gammaproteobacteria bacterium]|nr:prolyl oligopeptidase family serine peptidase [Gammaproteobacteria bacterium]